VITAVPLMIAAPLLALLLSLDPWLLGPLLLGLLLGTPTLAILGAIGAALTLGARRGGVLLSLLVLPLYIPILVFGAGAVEAASTGEAARGPLVILAAFLLAALALGPWATAASLRQAVQ
jgi:heme exporter protein B